MRIFMFSCSLFLMTMKIEGFCKEPHVMTNSKICLEMKSRVNDFKKLEIQNVGPIAIRTIVFKELISEDLLAEFLTDVMLEVSAFFLAREIKDIKSPFLVFVPITILGIRLGFKAIEIWKKWQDKLINSSSPFITEKEKSDLAWWFLNQEPKDSSSCSGLPTVRVSEEDEPQFEQEEEEKMTEQLAYHVYVSGIVQGVGYRYSTQYQAKMLNLNGWVRNLPDSRVECHLEGRKDSIEKMLIWLQSGPPSAKVDEVTKQTVDPEGFNDFEIWY